MKNIRACKNFQRLLVITGALFLTGVAPGTSINAYAAGPAGPGVETQVQTIVSYSKEQAVSLGQWEAQADGVTWKFKQFTGTYLTSSWIESQTEAGVWYFVDANGIMLTSTTTPDGYPVDSLGKWYSTTPQSTQPSNQQSTQSTTTPSWQGKSLDELTEDEIRQIIEYSSGGRITAPKGGNAPYVPDLIKGSQ